MDLISEFLSFGFKPDEKTRRTSCRSVQIGAKPNDIIYGPISYEDNRSEVLSC